MKIGIICADECELTPFIPVIQKRNITRHAMLYFHEGTIRNADVVAVYSGVCKVNAAIAAQLMIDRFNAEMIINAGTAGGMDERLEIFDTVAAETAASLARCRERTGHGQQEAFGEGKTGRSVQGEARRHGRYLHPRGASAHAARCRARRSLARKGVPLEEALLLPLRGGRGHPVVRRPRHDRPPQLSMPVLQRLAPHLEARAELIARTRALHARTARCKRRAPCSTAPPRIPLRRGHTIATPSFRPSEALLKSAQALTSDSRSV